MHLKVDWAVERPQVTVNVRGRFLNGTPVRKPHSLIMTILPILAHPIRQVGFGMVLGA